VALATAIGPSLRGVSKFYDRKCPLGTHCPLGKNQSGGSGRPRKI